MRSEGIREDDDTDLTTSPFCWWRSLEELSSGKWSRQGLTPDHGSLLGLTSRLRVLREMERLALVAPKGLDELRHKLMVYRAGDLWLPTGGVRKEDMVIPPVVTVLLVGLSGTGKSSLVNLMCSVLGRAGLIPFAQTSNGSSRQTSVFLEEHNVLRSTRSGFCVYNSRGLDMDRTIEGLEEVRGWMSCGVRHYQPCLRPGDGEELVRDGSMPPLSSARFNTRQVNCVLVVANASAIYSSLKACDAKALEATAELFHCPAIRKSNKTSSGDSIHIAIASRSASIWGILPEESDPVTAFALAEAIYRALIQSDRTHLPKRKAIDWVLLFLSWIMCSIASFFAVLAYIFSKLGRKNKLKF
ncbi:hypothetical protein CDL15_Pgr016655 [Punica granatum]|uniref:G domain-containing protein n=1 Tax=Punica granatum TaxID=22663 RepID=A0A218XUY6_PUNGR|nr:hypothetical protein CDL15_Pgr016655 [Punica granatum]